ncbi:ATP-binding cassette domain-containing protein [Photorhabdus laumondii]
MFKELIKQKGFLGLLVYIFFISSFSLMIPVSLKVIIDYILVEKVGSVFFILMFSLMTLVIFKFFFNLLQDIYFMSFRQSYEKYIVSSYFSKGFSPNLKQGFSDGEHLSKITSFINSFQFNLVTVIYYLGYSIAVSLLSLVLLLTQSTPIFIIVIIFLCLHWLNYIVHFRSNASENAIYLRKLSNINDFLILFSRYFPSIKIYSLEEQFKREFSYLSDQLFSSGYTRDMISSSQELIQDFLLYSSYGVIIVVLSQDAMLGNCSIGSLLMILMILQFCFEPIYRLSLVAKQASEMKAKLERLNKEIINVNNDDKYHLDTIKIKKINLINLSYFIDGVEVFKGINYTFNADNIYILKGGSGEGKSTILKIISGLITDFNGDVEYIDYNEDVVDRPLLGYMDQKHKPFRTSLNNNTSLFSTNKDINKLNLVHSISGINKLKLFDDNSESRNIIPSKLSGGEKSRLAISQALYSDSSIIILDEPTGSLDSQSEKNSLINF